MAIELREVGPDSLEQYGEIPIIHRVESIFRIDEVEGRFGGLSMTEAPLERPYVKNLCGDSKETAANWPTRFDVSNWFFLMAFDGEKAVGGAAVAFRSPEVKMLQGRDDLAVLWDIRVDPDYKRRGIGSLLMDRVVQWARSRGCMQLKIETQNNNVPACRFYAARGCRLGTIDRHAYSHVPGVAHEAMLVWYLDL